MLVDVEKINKYKNSIMWHTMDGREMRIDEMDTSHIFNSMKMIFNHMADMFQGEPIWYVKKYPGWKVILTRFII